MFYLLICVSGIASYTQGYHYSYPTPPTPFNTPIAPSFSHFGSGPQTGFPHGSRQTQGHKLYEWNKQSGNTYGSSVSGIASYTQGYHYSNPTPPTPFNTPTAPSFSHFGSGPQTGFPHGSWQTQGHKLYEWNKQSGNTYGSSQMGHNYGTEMLPSPDLASNPSDNFQAMSGIRNISKPTTENDPMGHIKKNDTTTSTTRRPVTTRPPATQRPSGPEPGTMSQPVPKLGELFAPSLQWHVGIYSKRFSPYMQVCGGTLVRADVVLSAAHCFWADDVGALRAGLFAVAAGKLLRPWETEGENYGQHSDIKEIKIPPRFQGAKTSFQDDIAIVFLSRPLEYGPGVKPVCLSFDQETERRHLKSGNLGKIAGWGLTMPNGPPSQRLNYLDLPYVDIEECIRTAEPSFLKYITSDKICAGDQKTGRALCRGDSGGGLVYNSRDVPYLVGIASTAPRDDNQCNAYAVATFTNARAHSAFLLEHVPSIGEGCEELYSHETRSAVVQNETIVGITENPTIQEVYVQTPQLGVASPNEATVERMANIVTDNGGVREPVTADEKMDETIGVTENSTIQGEQIYIQQLGVALPDAVDRMLNIFIKEPVMDQKMVMMSVESGERGVVRVPVEAPSTLVFNCYCKN